jgi:thioredoxin-related protein
MFSQLGKTTLKTFTFEEVEKLHQQKPKPIVVFIHTDWCKFCFGMNKTTFRNTEVIKQLNTNFYFVKFNGEEKKDITFLSNTFTYKPTGTNTGIHELANELASKNGRIAYPTTVILNSEFEINLQLSGYVKSKKMISLLNKIEKMTHKN